MQRRFGEIGSGCKNCQHSNQITFFCHYMSVSSSLILSLPNFIVSVYSSTLPRIHCVTSHSLRNRLDSKVWNSFGSGQKLGKYDKWRQSKKTRFSEQIKDTDFYWQVNVVPGKLICSGKNEIQCIWNERIDVSG